MAQFVTKSGLAYSTLAPFGGESKPWVVFHHGLGMSGNAWSRWFPYLLADYRILTFDVRGYGESRLDPARLGERTIDAWVDDLIEVLNDREISEAYLIGESLGGTSILHAGARHPDRVRACVVCSTGYKGSVISELKKWRGIMDAGGIGAWSKYLNENRFTERDDPGVWESTSRLQLACSPELILHDADMLAGIDLSEELRTMSKPTLILAPGASPFISREHSQELEKILPDATLVMIGPSKHGIAWAYAEECAFITRRYFEYLARRSGRPAVTPAPLLA